MAPKRKLLIFRYPIFQTFFIGIFFIPLPSLLPSFLKSGTGDSRPNIPFTSQAPFGNWKDLRQKNGCEEASILMALYWVRNKPLDKTTSEREIIAMAEFEKKTYGFFEDTSAEQTAQLIKDYFRHNNVRVQKNISKEDMVTALQGGTSVLIIPVHGQKLKNPYFTGAGPERHMLVVYGYDKRKKRFITNDPGTRRGRGFQYKEKIIMEALRDYPSGSHIPITKRETAMIIVTK